jgi:hypothetical protein
VANYNNGSVSQNNPNASMEMIFDRFTCHSKIMIEMSPVDNNLRKDPGPHPASEAVDGKQSSEGRKRTFTNFNEDGFTETSSSLFNMYKDSRLHSDRCKNVISATVKSDLFETNMEPVETFPSIVWDDEDENEHSFQPIRKRQRMPHSMVEMDQMPRNNPRRPRLLRSKSIYFRLYKLQESSLIASSYYQYCIQKTNDTLLWLDTIEKVEGRTLVKDLDETLQDSDSFEFSLQVVA